MTAALSEIIERVEGASGPDRELDAVIAAAVSYAPKDVGSVWRASILPNVPETGCVTYCTSLGTPGPWSKVPLYTSSIDAALTLVPEGWMWTVGSDAYALVGSETAKVRSYRAKTPALALCAAALRARLATQEQQG